jgi:hypothetical protein
MTPDEIVPATDAPGDVTAALIARLRVENMSLRAQNDRLEADWHKVLQERDENWRAFQWQAKKVEELRALLKKIECVEWCDVSDDDYCCPECGGEMPYTPVGSTTERGGHLSDCALAAALKEVK